MGYKEEIAFSKGYRVTEDGTQVKNLRTGNSLSCWIDKKSYRCFNIRTENRKKLNISVHRLQAYQKFREKLYEEGIVVRHLDGDSLNNAISNIEIGTQTDNLLDRSAECRLLHARKAARVNRKLTEEQVLSLLKDRSTGQTYVQLAEKYGLTKSTVGSIIRRETYTDLNQCE